MHPSAQIPIQASFSEIRKTYEEVLKFVRNQSQIEGPIRLKDEIGARLELADLDYDEFLHEFSRQFAVDFSQTNWADYAPSFCRTDFLRTMRLFLCLPLTPLFWGMKMVLFLGFASFSKEKASQILYWQPSLPFTKPQKDITIGDLMISALRGHHGERRHFRLGIKPSAN